MGRPYKRSDNNTILKCIAESPTNLKAAFYCASTLITNKKPASIANYWYRSLQHKSGTIFSTKSKVSTTPNTKNTRGAKKAYSYVTRSKPTTLSVSKGKLDLGGGKFIMGDFTITL